MLDELVGGPAAALTAVALVVGPGARASGWGARAAIALAARWRGPRRVLLADLDLERPALHEAAGVPNEEGVIDLVDYGISLGRLIRAAGGGAYDLLPAGIFTPSPGDILRHPAWTRVLLEVAARRSTLLAWVPAEADGVDAVIERAGAVLVLADAGEARAVVERLAHPYAVLAILTPEPPASPPRDAVTALAAAGMVDENELVEAVPAISAVEAVQVKPEPVEPVAAVVADEDAVEAAPDVEADEAVPDIEADEATEAAVVAMAAPAVPVAATPVVPTSAPVAASPPVAGTTPGMARRSQEEFERIRLPKDAAGREALILELRERQRAARLAGAADAPPLSPEAAAAARGGGGGVETAPPAGARRSALGSHSSTPIPILESPRARQTRRFARPLVWTVGVVLLASLLAGAWHFLGGRLLPVDPAAVAPAPAPVAPRPIVPVVQNALPYVVAIEAHRDMLTATERVGDLTEMEPGLLFHVETLERDGALFYHVMAGPVRDSATALALRDTLIARGHKTGPTPTDVRATPLAFLIGDYGTRATAEQQREVLLRLDIPAYVLQGQAADGQPVFRLYAGGFSTDAEADIVGQLLRAAGIRDSLVTRTGSTTVTDSLVTATGSSNP